MANWRRKWVIEKAVFRFFNLWLSIVMSVTIVDYPVCWLCCCFRIEVTLYVDTPLFDGMEVLNLFNFQLRGLPVKFETHPFSPQHNQSSSWRIVWHMWSYLATTKHDTNSKDLNTTVTLVTAGSEVRSTSNYAKCIWNHPYRKPLGLQNWDVIF